jgi:cysteine dioxygenase
MILKDLEHIITDVLNTNPDFENKREKMIERLNPLELEKQDWSKYCFFENSSYTRNAIIHNELFSLLVICWDKCTGSPIHDHPSDGCWIIGLDGTVEEKRYITQKDGTLKETECSLVKPGELSWMHNSIGYHKVGNPSPNMRATTLHIYSPPYKMCKGIKENGEFWYCAPKYYSMEGERIDS